MEDNGDKGLKKTKLNYNWDTKNRKLVRMWKEKKTKGREDKTEREKIRRTRHEADAEKIRQKEYAEEKTRK